MWVSWADRENLDPDTYVIVRYGNGLTSSELETIGNIVQQEWSNVVAFVPVINVDNETLDAFLELISEFISGAEEFDARTWALNFLTAPNGNLGWVRPVDLMHTDDGMEKVKGIITASFYGVYL